MKSLTRPLFVWLQDCLALCEVLKPRPPCLWTDLGSSRKVDPGEGQPLPLEDLLAILWFAAASTNLNVNIKSEL